VKRRIPIVSTIVVLSAVALMIGLGFWQIARLHQKEALLALLDRNPTLAPISFPIDSRDETLLFRHASLDCAAPGKLEREGAGKAGTRFIVSCANGARVQLGTSLDPRLTPDWSGGQVTGVIGTVPDHRPLIAAAFAPRPVQLMLVADPPLAGLEANQLPNSSEIPNNHLSYVIQWFLFAATALVIYALALRKRWQAQD